jgi:hypothetical protein
MRIAAIVATMFVPSPWRPTRFWSLEMTSHDNPPQEHGSHEGGPDPVSESPQPTDHARYRSNEEIMEPPQPGSLIDEEIRNWVRQRMFEDFWLDARYVEIEVVDRVVTLTGSVRTHLEGRYAWDDAWETEGVRGVVSEIEVAPGQQSRRQEPGH